MSVDDDSSTYLDDAAPDWMKAPVKWQEDDAMTPDRERGHDAWRRLFGKPITDEVLVAEYDGGDTLGSLYEGGKVYVNCCGLAEIRELPADVEHPKRGAPILCLSSHDAPVVPNDERKKEIRKMVFAALRYHVEADLNGDEQLMKEVWENTDYDAEVEVVKDALREVLEFLDDAESG